MPEGPEVKHLSDVLNRDLAGCYIQSIKNTEKSRYRNGNFPNQEHILAGTKIVKIYARSKKIIWTLLTPNNKEIFFITFAAIHGHWLYEEEKCTRVIFELNDRTIYYDDRDNKGTLQVCLNKEELENAFKNIGPDLLSDSSITFVQYLEKIRSKRIKSKQIGAYLLEQKYFSGIGNIYRSEILYYAGIHPFRSLDSLSDSEIELIFKITLYILNFSYRVGGVSVMTYKDPNGIKGGFTPAIYGRTQTIFGHTIKAETAEDDRKVYYSPDIQKL